MSTDYHWVSVVRAGASAYKPGCLAEIYDYDERMGKVMFRTEGTQNARASVAFSEFREVM